MIPIFNRLPWSWRQKTASAQLVKSTAAQQKSTASQLQGKRGSGSRMKLQLRAAAAVGRCMAAVVAVAAVALLMGAFMATVGGMLGISSPPSKWLADVAPRLQQSNGISLLFPVADPSRAPLDSIEPSWLDLGGIAAKEEEKEEGTEEAAGAAVEKEEEEEMMMKGGWSPCHESRAGSAGGDRDGSQGATDGRGGDGGGGGEDEEGGSSDGGGGGGAEWCVPPDIIAVLRGPLPSRAIATCAATSLSSHFKSSLQLIWPVNTNPMRAPRAAFSKFFQLPGSFPRVLSVERVAWEEHGIPPRGFTRRTINFKSCPSISNETLSVELLLSSAALPTLSSQEELSANACDLMRKFLSCFHHLQPSIPVKRIVRKNLLSSNVSNSVAIYVEDEGSGRRPFGCLRSPYRTYMIRRLTLEYLKRSYGGRFVVSATTPSNATAVASAFHPLASPAILPSSISRQQRCSEQQQDDEGGESMECALLHLADLFSLATSRGLLHCTRSPEALFVLFKGRSRQYPGDKETPKENEGGGKPRVNAGAYGIGRAAFANLGAVCLQNEIPPIKSMVFSQHIIIEDRLSLLLCVPPKAACSSWKMWLRGLKGLPSLPDAAHIHDFRRNSLGEVWKRFSEPEAIRLLSRPDLFRFTMVRNPFSRLPSAYFNKIVKGDTEKGEGSRYYWMERILGLSPSFKTWRSSHDFATANFSFGEFATMVEEVMREKRGAMDRHVAPQVDLCGLNSIKYDFVGKFEKMNETINFMSKRFGDDNPEEFSWGKSVHFTGADNRLLQVYDKDTFTRVGKMHAMDLNVPLNDIHYEPLESLSQTFS